MVDSSEIETDQNLNQLVNQLKKYLAPAKNKTPFIEGYAEMVKLQRLRFAFQQLQSLQYQDKQKQFEVVILIFPFLLENSNNKDSLNTAYKIVEHEAKRLNFTVENLYPPLKAAGFDHLLIKQNDGIHPNALGHRLTADILLKIIPYK